jgi:prepilin-type N-terminal cleavage/methylation domain-containing protein
MKMVRLPLHGRRAGGTASAFTLTELTVVLAVAGLLAGLHLSTAARNSRQVKRAQCVGNLQQFALATQIYASENRELLPEIAGGNWAWDVPAGVTTALLNRGMERKHFYCPGTAPRFNDNVNFLDPFPNSLWTYGQPTFRIIGYLAAFSGPAGNPNQFRLYLTNQNTTILSERPRLSFSVVGGSTYLDTIPPNSERVLLADATISEFQAGTPSAPAPAGSFANVIGGFAPNGVNLPHTSPHLRGALPQGGNAAFKDGHAQWRPFAVMSVRGSGDARGFWW